MLRTKRAPAWGVWTFQESMGSFLGVWMTEALALLTAHGMQEWKCNFCSRFYKVCWLNVLHLINGILFSFLFVEIELGWVCFLCSPSSLFKPTFLTINIVIHLKELKIIWERELIKWIRSILLFGLPGPSGLICAFLFSFFSSLCQRTGSFLSRLCRSGSFIPWCFSFCSFRNSYLTPLISSMRLSSGISWDTDSSWMPFVYASSLLHSCCFPEGRVLSSVLGVFRLTFVQLSAPPPPPPPRLCDQGSLWDS